jgi:polyisoprenoid-binding protein YceI
MSCLLTAGANAQRRSIDTSKSQITIHVGRTGFLASFGDEHWVRAPIVEGSLNDGENPSIEFVVDAKKLEVLPDKKINAKKQAQIQANMGSEVLDPTTFPRITFRSTDISKAGPNWWKVTGVLTLHGVTKSIIADVHRTGDTFSGTSKIKQTDFGIKPIRIMGGMIKVRDQLDVSFEIVTGSG